MTRAACALCLAVGIAGCGDNVGAADAAANIDAPPTIDAGPPPDALVATCNPIAGTDLALELVSGGLVDPVFVTSPPGDERLFVVEKAGRILVIDDGVLQERPFLDITDRVEGPGNEQGLLGLAFHPDWATDRRFYVYHTDGGGDPWLNVVAEYRQQPGHRDRADRGSERRVLEVGDPASTHNAGMIGFGPDGYLYVGMGDGGGAGDPNGNAQDRSTLLGDMLRIDVDGEPYAIPPDNPYAGRGGEERPEIWLSGLRNPWRWSFDRLTGDLFIGDVGQNTWEEVDFIPAGQSGKNLGWDVVEGNECFQADSCSTAGFVDPIYTYEHVSGSGCRCVIGGYRYRGSCRPDLAGQYFFADHCQGRVFTLEVDGDGDLVAPPEDVTADLDPDNIIRSQGIVSFGEDALGELYLVLRTNGEIYRITGQP
ncbi:MAG TPA: PQQ-dependent sugar dehydrogenase [Kofleriaceae bacterium]|nr:PQQ-dependent sugar dehydrogenase [Kofleriaceae bacterium]